MYRSCTYSTLIHICQMDQWWMSAEHTPVWEKWGKEKVDIDTNWEIPILGICLSCNLEAIITTLYLIFFFLFQTHFKTFAIPRLGERVSCTSSGLGLQVVATVQFYEVLGISPRASCMLARQSLYYQLGHITSPAFSYGKKCVLRACCKVKLNWNKIL